MNRKLALPKALRWRKEKAPALEAWSGAARSLSPATSGMRLYQAKLSEKDYMELEKKLVEKILPKVH